MVTVVTMFLGVGRYQKDRHHRHDRHGTVFRRGAGCPFQRAALLGSCPQATGQSPFHPVGRNCAFDGSAVKSAFALLLEKVTKPAADAAKGRVDLYGLGLEEVSV